jgi:membrane-associated protease RseP (regulator of RpoE activity)
VDQQYNGVGVRIQGVLRGSPAAQVGLAAGDVITKLDDTDIKDFNDLRKVLGAKKQGDKIAGEFTRGGETKKFSGQFPEEKPEPAYRRTKTTGSIEAKAEGNTINVRVKNVARYTLFVNREQFDLDKPVRVLTNGEETSNDTVKPDLVFMLEQYAADNDRTMVYCAKIEMKVPEKEAKDEGKKGEEEKPEEDK